MSPVARCARMLRATSSARRLGLSTKGSCTGSSEEGTVTLKDAARWSVRQNIGVFPPPLRGVGWCSSRRGLLRATAVAAMILVVVTSLALAAVTQARTPGREAPARHRALPQTIAAHTLEAMGLVRGTPFAVE